MISKNKEAAKTRDPKAPMCVESPSKPTANVAQLVEQLTRNEQVTGSSPVVGSVKTAASKRVLAVFLWGMFTLWVSNPFLKF